MTDERVSKQAAALVAYEYRTMLKTAEVLEELDMSWPVEDEQVEEHELQMRVYLESFLVHYRNLVDFLAPSKIYSSDITAGPFIGKTRKYCVPSAPVEYQADINKRLSHISTERGDGQQYWEGSAMTEKLHQSYEEFLGMLDDEKRRWFTNPVNAMKDRRPGFYNS